MESNVRGCAALKCPEKLNSWKPRGGGGARAPVPHSWRRQCSWLRLKATFACRMTETEPGLTSNSTYVCHVVSRRWNLLSWTVLTWELQGPVVCFRFLNMFSLDQGKHPFVCLSHCVLLNCSNCWSCIYSGAAKFVTLSYYSSSAWSRCWHMFCGLTIFVMLQLL